MEKWGNMLFKGFRLGMLLQLAVGPVCAYIFQSAAASGFWAAETGVLGVALADGLCILAALFGVGALLSRKASLKRALKFGGAAVMALFGLWLLLDAAIPGLLPGFTWTVQGSGMFATALLLTLSNPLTIMFWAGVFAQRAAEDSVSRGGLLLYGTGALLSTIVFLSAVAALGGVLRSFLPDIALRIMNGAVGGVLIFFAVRTAMKKDAGVEAGLM